MVNKFNENVVRELGKYVEFMVDKVNYSSDDKNYCSLLNYQVIESNNLDISYLRMTGRTGSMTVRYNFRTVVDGESEEYSSDLEIPKLINNVFVVGGALRIPTNTLDRDDRCTVYSNNVIINDQIDVRFTEDKSNPDGYDITISLFDSDDNEVKIPATDDNLNKYKDNLKLTEYEVDKIKVKLDTDNVGNYLTKDIILKMIERGEDKKYDSMIDKKIWSTESNFLKYLYGRDVRPRVTRDIRKKYYQYKRIFLRSIQTCIDQYFKIANEKNIDIPNTINPLVFDSMKFKVTIPKNVAVNDSMTDLIDIVNTPINGNTNQINEMNYCAELRDNEMYIKCYTFPDQKEVTIPYTKYCTKKVLINQYWDYENKKFKSKDIKYKLRLKYYDGTSSDKFDLIEPMPDHKLSITSMLIPMGNASDSIRLSMGTASMLKQAIELPNGEPNLISSGHDKEVLENSTLVSRHEGEDATVVGIRENKIFFKNAKGSVYFTDISSPIVGANDSIISFDPAVKVGQSVKSGDIVVVPKVMKRGSFDIGINSRVIYMNYLGYTHEDGIVISKSHSDRLMHFSLINFSIDIYPDDIISYVKKIGSAVESKDIIVNNLSKLRINPNLGKNLTTGLLKGLGISYNQANLLVPNNVDEGFLIDIRVEIKDGIKFTNPETVKILESMKSQEKSSDYDWIPQKYKDLKADEVEMDERAAGYISAKVLRVNRAKLGDKVVNNYGSKGVISLILPDECMPQIESPDGKRTPSEILLNPAAVISRKNISQLYETSLSKCVLKIYSILKNKMDLGKVSEAKKFTEKYYGKKFTIMSDEEFSEYFKSTDVFGFKLEVGFYSKISYDTLVEWMNELGVKDTDVIFCPDVIIAETDKGIQGFSPKDYVPKAGDRHRLHELGYVEGESVTGLSYIKKLSHSADYTGKVTSSIDTKDEDSIFGRGRYRKGGGQSIGEMELDSLLAMGTEKFIENVEKDGSNDLRMINMVTATGFIFRDPEGNLIPSTDNSRARALRELTENA
jgi:DNA-directed RNA polymerase, beta subunit